MLSPLNIPLLPLHGLSKHRARRIPPGTRGYVFPGEFHHLKRNDNQLRKVTGEQAWLARGRGL